jgi:hypothetical protein
MTSDRAGVRREPATQAPARSEATGRRRRPVLSAQEILWRSMTEKQWEKWVVGTAHDFGWERYHPWLSIHSPRGWPDEALCRPPRLVLAELKTMAGKLGPAQERWQELLKQCPGVEVYVWRPCDQEQVARVLAPEGRTIHF